MSSKSETFLIVGGGLAGAKAAEALRDKDFDGDIVLFATEQHLPYERPPLSKEYLAGKKTFEEFTTASRRLVPRPPRRLAARHSGVLDQSHGHLVGLPDGAAALRQTAAGHRVGATTAADSRRRSRPGALPSHRRRRRRPRAVLIEGSSLAIVGGGWIGLEVAADARERGANVTVVEAAELPLLGALGREAAEVFAKLHRDHGVDLRLGATVEEITTATARRPVCASATGPPSTPTPSWSPSVRRRTPNSPGAGLTMGPTVACRRLGAAHQRSRYLRGR